MRKFIVSLGCTLAAGVWSVSPPAFAQDTHQGRVVAAGSGTLTMTDTAGQHKHTHEVGDNVAVTCDGKPCKLAEVKTGSTVTVTTEQKNGAVSITKIDAQTMAGY